MRILFLGTYDVRRHPRVGVLLEGLRANGDEVVEVNAPLGLNTAGRVAVVRRPWLAIPALVALARCWVALARGVSSLRRNGFRPDVVVVGYLGLVDIHLARLLVRGTPIVLDHLVSGRPGAAPVAARARRGRATPGSGRGGRYARTRPRSAVARP
jgi:hypothetical protein